MFNTILCTTLVVLCIGIVGCIWCLCRIASKQTPTPEHTASDSTFIDVYGGYDLDYHAHTNERDKAIWRSLKPKSRFEK